MNAALLQLLAAPLLAAAPAVDHDHEEWIPILSIPTPVGKPAQLTFVPELSDAQTTTLELEIFGYFRKTVIGPDGVAYERLRFPGLGEFGQIGAPELPALRTRLAVATDASATLLADAFVAPGDVHSKQMLLYPEPLAGADGEDPDFGDTKGTDEQFVIDSEVYAMALLLPAVNGAVASAPVEPFQGAVPTSEITMYPVQYLPTEKRLTVNAKTTYTFRHPGTPSPLPELTKDKFAMVEASCPNWPAVSDWIKSNEESYHSRYLVVTPEGYLDELATFIDHREAMGYDVTVITLESLQAAVCGEIRAAIGAWYTSGPAQFDHYCLLVGDSGQLPMCTSPNAAAVPTDDLYGSPFGVGGLDEEIYVGRLSVDNGLDVLRQTEKIIAYELDDDTGHDYSDVLLVAHEEDAPGKYVGAHEEVAAFPYATPLDFIKLYGNEFASTDAAVQAEIDADLGLVAYRGHGSSTRWSDWNLFGEDFSSSDVTALSNDQLPVVWSFSCTNGSIHANDSISEIWMDTANGAVAHYGSTGVSGTTKNHTLDKKMFEAVFDLGLTTQGLAIAWAEDQVRLLHPNNSYQNEWMYVLLGCPAMKIRTGTPKGLGIVAPTPEPDCSGPSCSYTVQVLGPDGGPLEGAQVSVTPTTELSISYEQWPTQYSKADGTATFVIPTAIEGLTVVVRDDQGNVVKQIVPTATGAFVDLGDALAGIGGEEPRLSSDSELLLGSKFRMTLERALPGTVGLLSIAPIDSQLPLFGGIVHTAFATLHLPVATSLTGTWALELESWPAMAAGTELFWQAGLIDPAAVQGVSLSNALRSTQP